MSTKVNSAIDIEGGSVIKSIIDLLFKGIDKILSDAAEYEEEMGVLKEVYKLPINKPNQDKKYTLTVKLSPVKNKDGVFYVEATSDAPDLDLSDIHQKGIKLDKTNASKFADKVASLLNASGYECPELKVSSNSSAESEGDAESEQPDENEDEVREEVDDLKDDLFDELKHYDIIVSNEEGSELFTVVATMKDYPDFRKCYILLTVNDIQKGDPVRQYKKRDVSIDTIDKNGDCISWEEFSNTVKQEIAQYIKDNNLVIKQSNVLSSTSSYKATFRNNGGNVRIVAIKASSDIRPAFESAMTLVENEDFISQIPEGTTCSFDISDEGSIFNIESCEDF